MIGVNSSRWMQKVKLLRCKDRFLLGFLVLSSVIDWLGLAKIRSDPALLGEVSGWRRGMGVVGIAGCL